MEAGASARPARRILLTTALATLPWSLRESADLPGADRRSAFRPSGERLSRTLEWICRAHSSRLSLTRMSVRVRAPVCADNSQQEDRRLPPADANVKSCADRLRAATISQ